MGWLNKIKQGAFAAGAMATATMVEPNKEFDLSKFLQGGLDYSLIQVGSTAEAAEALDMESVKLMARNVMADVIDKKRQKDPTVTRMTAEGRKLRNEKRWATPTSAKVTYTDSLSDNTFTNAGLRQERFKKKGVSKLEVSFWSGPIPGKEDRGIFGWFRFELKNNAGKHIFKIIDLPVNPEFIAGLEK